MDKKQQKKTISFINDDDKHFPDAAAVALNHEEMEKNLQRISNINSIPDGLFRSCSRIRGGSKPTPLPPPHAYPAKLKLGSYTLPKEDPKTILIT